MRRALAIALFLVGGSAGAAECRLEGKPFLVGNAGQGEAGRAVDARAGQTVTAWLVAPGRLDGKAVQFSEAPGARFVSWRAAGCGPVEIAWRRVEPRPVHTETTSPNKSTNVYSNAVVFGPKHGAWIGWDKLEYFETPLPGGDWSLAATAAHPTLAQLDIHEGLGVMRLAATIRAGGQRLSTADATDLDGPTVSDRVFRYTYRRGDDFLGWLTSYFNVPYLFASAGHFARAQAEHYVGADCADLLVAAMRRAGRRDLDYTSVNGFLDVARKVGGPVLVDPTPGAPPPAKRLRFGDGTSPGEVRPGDLLIIDYIGWDGTPRTWDHVLAVVEDRAPGGATPGDGFLGPEDLTADSGDAKALVFQPLALQGKINVLVLRIPLRDGT